MLTKGINFVNFKTKIKSLIIKKKLSIILKSKNEVLNSLSQNYKDNFTKKLILKHKKKADYRLIGMGGSSLGAQTIYDFLKHKIKKNFLFFNNLQNKQKKETKKSFTNLIVSKSGNTIETIVNSNILIKRNDKNILITENKKRYLYDLAEKLKAEIVYHNDFIGGRY